MVFACTARHVLRRSLPMQQQIRNKSSAATSVWEGTLKEGGGVMTSQTGAITNMAYSHPARFADDNTKTNPEELIGASISGCYSMFLSALLTKQELTPTKISTTAQVELVVGDNGPSITKIDLKNETKIDGIDDAKFQELAAEAKAKCPISKALAGVPEINLDAKLL